MMASIPAFAHEYKCVVQSNGAKQKISVTITAVTICGAVYTRNASYDQNLDGTRTGDKHDLIGYSADGEDREAVVLAWSILVTGELLPSALAYVTESSGMSAKATTTYSCSK